MTFLVGDGEYVPYVVFDRIISVAMASRNKYQATEVDELMSDIDSKALILRMLRSERIILAANGEMSDRASCILAGISHLSPIPKKKKKCRRWYRREFLPLIRALLKTKKIDLHVGKRPKEKHPCGFQVSEKPKEKKEEKQ
mgnify:CR=1 FL=1